MIFNTISTEEKLETKEVVENIPLLVTPRTRSLVVLYVFSLLILLVIQYYYTKLQYSSVHSSFIEYHFLLSLVWARNSVAY